MREAFIKYTEAGFICLPTKGDKSPDVKGTWIGGISDVEKYDNAYGIGIICGEKSGGLECGDFDNHFGDAKENLSQFLSIPEVKEIYNKHLLPIESTVSGGFHILWRCKKIEGNKKLASRPMKVGDKWRPDAIIETRGEGGYFCAAPTPGYNVIRNSLVNVPVITEQERDVLISFAKTFNTWNDVRKNEFENDDKPGDIYNTKSEAIEEMKDALINEGWKEVRQGIWRRPGKDDGISATLGKVADHVFYNFTANGHPFTENSGYTPFQVVGLLKYKGDFKAFAKELSDRYIEKKERKTDVPAHVKQKDKLEIVKTKTDYDNIIDRAYIDLSIPVTKPPVIMKIRDIEGGMPVDRRLFTLGNFSCTTGKSKSKKTFLSSLFLASASINGILQNKFISDFPDNKVFTMLFDTEQSRYDSYMTAIRIPHLLGLYPKNFGAYDLREYSPKERCEIIEEMLERMKSSVGFVVIDGIADLAMAINDEAEASRVVSLLMRWTKVYNCHIHVIIHENKGDNNATGHLGSSILKKAETIISVTKDPDDFRKSFVKCTLIRGTMDFKDFAIEIDENSLPKVESGVQWAKYDEPVERAF